MRLGLTGGIGCGKSTVIALFAKLGWHTLEADAIVRDLLTTDAAIKARLRERWGALVFDVKGAVDRHALAHRVFADTSELTWLEALLHPQVNRIWREALAAAPKADWVVEIPLLFEKNLAEHFDFTVCVETEQSIIYERMTKRGFSAEQVRSRLNRQMPLEEKINRADFVLSNSGSLNFLQTQVEALNQRIRAD